MRLLEPSGSRMRVGCEGCRMKQMTLLYLLEDARERPQDKLYLGCCWDAVISGLAEVQKTVFLFLLLLFLLHPSAAS